MSRANSSAWNPLAESSTSLEYSNRVSVTSRRRSIHYYLAKDALSKVADGGRKKLDLSPLIIHFENWMEKYLQGRFVKLNKGDEWLFIRCLNRFMSDYKRVVWKKLKLLQFIEWDLKLELTLDPKKFMRLDDEIKFINKAWAKLRSWLLKKYRHFEFLKILEFQKLGRPHLHVLIKGILYIPHEDLTTIWQKYGGGWVWIRSLGRNVNAVWYVLKYVNKTISGKNKVFASLLFASNKRIFSMSQNLMAMLNIKRNRKEQGWTFKGTVHENTVKAFCREKEIPFQDIIQVEVTTDMLYEYSMLFAEWEAG